MREKRFEVLYYTVDNNYEALTFATRKQALKFYEEHKDDNDKFGWWVTHRDADWSVIEDIIY